MPKKKTNGTPHTPVKRNPLPHYDFGSTIEEAISRFDGAGPYEKVVFNCFLAGARAQWSETLREAAATKGAALTSSDVDDLAASWKPTVKRRGDAPDAKAKKLLSSLTAEEKQALAQALK